MIQQKRDNTKKHIYRWNRKFLIILPILLLTLFAGVPGVLRLVYRADAQVALGHAKSVRMAIQITGAEQYSKGKGFCDATREGGVSEALYQKILNLSDAPGEFWVLQVGNDGYKVKQFVYREGNYTVWYQANPRSYQVYRGDEMISTEKIQDETGEK